MELEHSRKVKEMQTELLEIKSGFDRRCTEFKKQIEEFKANNEAVEALKKAHAKEIAVHVQEHNRKYNDLLTEKLNSEDAIKAKAEAEKAGLIKEWTAKVGSEVKSARSDE
jgi:hypothetical protein